MGKRFFLDTYAMIEVLEGNPNYDKYANCTGITSTLNLYELYVRYLRSHGEEIARVQTKKFQSISININLNHIQKAANLKLNKKLGYIDAMGYAIAQLEGIKILSGDDDFKDLEGVEFVK